MPASWNQFLESGFPIDDYDKEVPLGEYEVILDGVCYAKTSSQGTGIHLFARHSETGKKYWFFVFYVSWHPSYGTAKAAKSGERIRLVVEMGKRGTPMVKDVTLPLGAP